ncbi:hypothetical protein AVXHC19_45540 [Acidovorax sacchari]
MPNDTQTCNCQAAVSRWTREVEDGEGEEAEGRGMEAGACGPWWNMGGIMDSAPAGGLHEAVQWRCLGRLVSPGDTFFTESPIRIPFGTGAWTLKKLQELKVRPAAGGPAGMVKPDPIG